MRSISRNEDFMTDLVKLLLDNDENSGIKALHFYNKAMRHLRKRLKSKEGSTIIGADEISEILERHFNRELSKMKLSDLDQYQKIKTSIEEWQPRLKPKEY